MGGPWERWVTCILYLIESMLLLVGFAVDSSSFNTCACDTNVAPVQLHLNCDDKALGKCIRQLGGTLLLFVLIQYVCTLKLRQYL